MDVPISMDQTPVGKMIEPITQNKDALSAIMEAIIQLFQGQGQQQPPAAGPLPQVQFDAQGNQVFDPSGAAAITPIPNAQPSQGLAPIGTAKPSKLMQTLLR